MSPVIDTAAESGVVARAPAASGRSKTGLPAASCSVCSRTIGEMAVERPTFINAAAGLAPAGIVPAAGGVLIRNGEGDVIGAVGVTGDTSDNDELCAMSGIENAGLKY